MNKNFSKIALVIIVVGLYLGVRYFGSAIHYACANPAEDCPPPINAVGQLGFYITGGPLVPLWLQEAPSGMLGHKNAAYMIEGERVELHDGIAETDAAPGSAAKNKTQYFGNELKADLNGDGREDVAFIVTQDRGGSGTFFYAVAALNMPEGYVGSDGYLLGDRIAPQSTTLSPNPRHKQVVVFNYAERAPGEAMTVAPSVGKSAYLKLDPESMQWGIVEPDFEGESR